MADFQRREDLITCSRTKFTMATASKPHFTEANVLILSLVFYFIIPSVNIIPFLLPLQIPPNLLLQLLPNFLVPPKRNRIRKSDELRTSLHNHQRIRRVSRRLTDPHRYPRQPKYDIEYWIGV